MREAAQKASKRTMVSLSTLYIYMWIQNRARRVCLLACTKNGGGAKAYYKFSLARGNLITRRGSIEGERALIEAWATPALCAPSKIRRVLPGKRRLVQLLCFFIFFSPCPHFSKDILITSTWRERRNLVGKGKGKVTW